MKLEKLKFLESLNRYSSRVDRRRIENALLRYWEYLTSLFNERLMYWYITCNNSINRASRLSKTDSDFVEETKTLIRNPLPVSRFPLFSKRAIIFQWKMWDSLWVNRNSVKLLRIETIIWIIQSFLMNTILNLMRGTKRNKFANRKSIYNKQRSVPRSLRVHTKLIGFWAFVKWILKSSLKWLLFLISMKITQKRNARGNVNTISLLENHGVRSSVPGATTPKAIHVVSAFLYTIFSGE